MEQFTDEELQDILMLGESRIHADNYFKASIPQIDVIGDMATATAIVQKTRRIIMERAEDKKAQEAKKEVKEG